MARPQTRPVGWTAVALPVEPLLVVGRCPHLQDVRCLVVLDARYLAQIDRDEPGSSERAVLQMLERSGCTDLALRRPGLS